MGVAGVCSPAKGKRNQLSGKTCKTNLGTDCDFSREYQIQIKNLDPIVKFVDKCKLIGIEGYSANTFYCIDTEGTLAGCANNCPGVDPRAIIVGGGLVSASAIAGTLGFLNALPFWVGAGAGVGALGLGTTRAMCVSPWCSARSGQCCLLIGIGFSRRPRCPRSC